MTRESKASRLRRIAATWLSIESIGYYFASVLFGTYVLGLEAALSSTWPPNWPDMLEPIRMSLVAWFVVSVLYLIGQAATKRGMELLGGVVIGAISLAGWSLTYAPIMANLNTVVVPWFVNLLNLEPATKLLVGAVFLIAFLYVLFSPLLWRRYFRATMGKPEQHRRDSVLGSN